MYSFRNAFIPSIMASIRSLGLGRSTFSNTSVETASSEGETISASIRSRRTSGLSNNVPFVSMATGTLVIDLMPRMISPIFEFNVGSPEPEMVMWSRSGYSAITSFTSARISVAGRYSFLARPRLSVTPTSQYTQSREQSFFGITSTPRDNPNRRDGTGPNVYFRCVVMVLFKTQTPGLSFHCLIIRNNCDWGNEEKENMPG